MAYKGPPAFVARGGAAELFECLEPAVLIEGPAGTGKTRAVLERALHFLEGYPNCRVLFLRKTRASQTESVLVIWERDVLWEGHEALKGAARAHRHSYKFRNNSEAVVGGMDNPDRIMSTEYDVICFFEATEFVITDYEKACTRLRNHQIPHPDALRGEAGEKLEQAICDCNPAHELHWLNRYAMEGRLHRILSRHEDNPTVTAEYLRKLDALTGVRRDRLYLGKWVSAEGQIWENWNPSVHIIPEVPLDANGDSVIKWYFASVDWGFRNPGVFQVWGVDKERRAYLIHEIYQTGKNPEWWAEKAVMLQQTYDLRIIVCDPAEPDNIDLFNSRLKRLDGRNNAFKANNAWKAGTDVVRERLACNLAVGIKPRLMILQNSCPSKDRTLLEKLAPVCLSEEIPSYIYRESKDGQQVREEPAPDAADHGCDACRYAMMWLDRAKYDPALDQRSPRYRDRPGTAGYILEMEKTFDEISKGKYL